MFASDLGAARDRQEIRMDEAILLRRVRLEEVRIVEETNPAPIDANGREITDPPRPRRARLSEKNDIERLLSDLAFFAHAWASSPRRPADATCGGQVWGRACGSPAVPANGTSRLIELGAERVSTKGDGAPVRTKLRTRISLKLLYNLTSPQLCEPTRHFFCNLISTSLEAVRQGHDGRYAGRDRSRVVEQRMQPELPIAVSITFSSRRYRTA